MDSYSYLLFIAIILLSTKVTGLMTEKIHMPQVVGALLAGIILGPSVLGVVSESDFLTKSSEIGVILLMFLAGLETDLDELKANGRASFVVALLGVLIPLAGGYGVYYFFFPEIISSDPNGVLKGIFIGATLTATSVSITVETLREMGKLRGKMGTTILGAAIIDDIFGIIVLTVIVGMTDPGVSILSVLLHIVEFFVCVALVSGFILFVKKHFIHTVKTSHRISIYALTVMFMMSYAAERFFGVADITGAYFAGIMLCKYGVRDYINNKVSKLGYLFFSPIFFASVGLKADVRGITPNLMLFALALVAIAVVTKIVGCGAGAKLFKFSGRESLAIGVGMVSRGEVALIVAQKGAEAGLLEATLFPPIVIMVIATTLFTPVFLKLILKNTDTGTAAEDNRLAAAIADPTK
ncbi:MAG: cation:proton antiporter [Firmicutes bacterium]|nr:cation:proton antiporter [Bacillota bacterium]